MNANAREVPAPESYATFWDPAPVAKEGPAPSRTPPADPKAPRDAYLEFDNVAEGVTALPRAERV
ncbi:MAG: hypothetical protein J0I06_16800 [Planctomycetes bacterium]|nr:hypothetical protein [Planctomycetota bacterium]